MRVFWIAPGLAFLISSCIYRDIEEPRYVCNPAKPPLYLDIESTLQTKCSIHACHDGSNPLAPTLLTEHDFLANKSDIIFQLAHDAMPPAGSSKLTSAELSKILCWIDAE